MSNIISGGAKLHLMKYSGVKVVDGVLSLSISASGRASKSCGGRYRGVLNATSFSSHLKSNADGVCKNCKKSYEDLIDKAKSLKCTVNE